MMIHEKRAIAHLCIRNSYAHQALCASVGTLTVIVGAEAFEAPKSAIMFVVLCASAIMHIFSFIVFSMAANVRLHWRRVLAEMSNGRYYDS